MKKNVIRIIGCASALLLLNSVAFADNNMVSHLGTTYLTEHPALKSSLRWRSLFRSLPVDYEKLHNNGQTALEIQEEKTQHQAENGWIASGKDRLGASWSKNSRKNSSIPRQSLVRPLPVDYEKLHNNGQAALEIQEEETQHQAENGWIASGKDLLGASWSKNPRKNSSIPRQFLYQFTANYSYSGQDGNVVADSHKASAELILRKQLLTSVSKYSVSKKETKKALTGVSINVDSESFFQALRYPLSDWAQIVGGGVWKINDSAKYIDNRSNYFGGFLFDVVDRPNIALTAGVFYGYSDVTYKNSILTGKAMYADFTPVDDYASDNIYFKHALRWNITDTITFTNEADYVQLLKDSNYYFWLVKTGLEFKLSQHMSFTASYTMDYDKNRFVEAVQNYFDARRAAGQPAGDMEELDTTLAVGIKINF